MRGCRCLGAAKHANEIGREYLIPELVGNEVEAIDRNRCFDARCARVVDKQVQAAKRADRLLDHGFSFFGNTDLARRADHIKPQLTQICDLLRTARIVREMIDRNLCTGMRQRGRRAQSDAAPVTSALRPESS